MAIALMICFGVILRVPSMSHVTGAPNLEASYHVLLTEAALRENAISSHWLLPTVTFAPDVDKAVPWGATVATARGDYIYTSFPPLGFLAPYAFFEIFQLELSIRSLMIFNLVLQVAACFLLYGLLLRLLSINGIKGYVADIAAVAGVSLQVLSCEALSSYGVVYWSQQLFQVIYLACLLCVTEILLRQGRRCRGLTLLLAVLCFLGAWTEWTGFVFNGGVFLALGWLARKDRQFVWIAGAVLAGTTAALLAIVIHFGLVLGLNQALYAFGKRFIARTARPSSGLGIVGGYVQSYGLLLLVVGGFAAYLAARRRGDMRGTAWLVFLCAAGAMLENIAMMQHASEFSFDRLKAVVPFAIIVAFGVAYMLASLGPQRAAILGTLFVVAALQNLYAYQVALERHDQWRQIDEANIALVRNLAAQVDLSCVWIATNLPVRGYANLLLHRAIHEKMTWQDFERSTLSVTEGRCGRVYLTGSMPYTDLPRFTEAVIDAAGALTRVRAVAVRP